MEHADSSESGLTWVGLATEVFRAIDPRFLDQAQLRFDEYVTFTLTGSQNAGGRFNPKGEFGAIYTASDEDTAWEEVAARVRRQGILGLPQTWGMLRILVKAGHYADLRHPDTRKAWGATLNDLSAPEPTLEQQERCWAVARGVRAVGDFLISPSARGEGDNIPLFLGRDGSELEYSVPACGRKKVPSHLVADSIEPW